MMGGLAPVLADAAKERPALLDAIEREDDPERLVDAAWRILYRVRDLTARVPGGTNRYKIDFLVEGCETGDLNLVEIGINRFRDIDPGEDDDED
jgi:hypothetical protein